MSWPLVKLKDVAEINPRLPKNVDESQIVTFLPMAAVSEQGQILKQEKRILNETRKGFTYFEKNDVVVAKITPCFENGKAAYLGSLETQIGFGTTEFHVIRADIEKLDAKYLFYLVWNKWFRHLGERNMSGSGGQKRVPADFLKELEIPLPPLDEQKRIAAILDKADAIRRKRQQAIQLADDFLRSVFLDMFGDPVTNPKGWEVKSLKDIARIQIGPFGTQLHKEDYIENGIPLINPTHIVKGEIIPKANLTISNEKHASLSEYHLKTGDIVMGRRGEMGRCAIVNSKEEGWMCGTGSLFIRPKQTGVFSEYLNQLLSSQAIKNHLESESQGATMPNLNKTIVGNIKIPVPTDEVLEQFTVIKETFLKTKSSVIDSLNAPLFESLSQKAFAGEL